MEYDLITLENGIRVVYKQVASTNLVHCGFILDIGSRDERPDQEGLAHFWEHMAFKGTEKRKAYHILNRIDSVGGELNAYTTKEKMCFYASTLSSHIDKSIELLTDITFNSVFPEKQIERERRVILEEMTMYKDNPEDAIQDEFDQVIFSGHPLGYNILGTQKSVRSFHRNDFYRFIEQNMSPGRIVFSIVGNLPPKKMERIVRKYIGSAPVQNGSPNREAYDEKLYVAKTNIHKKPISQAQCAIGKPAYPLKDERRIALMLLVNLLGGPGMNSRLNLGIREKYGFVYSIDAHYTPYLDTGLFSIFFGTEHQQLYRCVDLVLKELKKFKLKPLTNVQLHRAKEQFIGQLAMSEENNASLMLMMGRSLLDLELIPTFEEVVAQIRAVDDMELWNIANDIFDENSLSFLYYLPDQKNKS